MDECAKIGQGRYGHVRTQYGSVLMVDVPDGAYSAICESQAWCKLRVSVYGHGKIRTGSNVCDQPNLSLKEEETRVASCIKEP